MSFAFAALTGPETDRLWWRLVRATAAVADEIESLELAPARLRDELYGDRCLELYAGMMDELAALACELADSPLSRITVMRAEAPEEGQSPWHDSDATQATPRAPRLRQLAATLLANCHGPSRAAKRPSFQRKCSMRFWRR